MMFRKVFKFLFIIILMWIVAILSILRHYTKSKKIILYDALFNKVAKDENKSGFSAWDLITMADKITTEKHSIVMDFGFKPGDSGKPVILNTEILNSVKSKIKQGWKDYAFNSFVSDLIPINRTLIDSRHDWCKKRTYRTLPTASVVICFHNEAKSTLLRTLRSVLDRSPNNLLDEIILVDDGSTMNHVVKSIKDYIRPIAKVKLVQTYKREGLIRARMIGLQHVKSSVVVFLDSHCECTKGWLEPLLERIAQNPSTIASPVIDHIHDSTFEYKAQDNKDLRIGGFTWGMKFKWIPIPKNVVSTRKNVAAPIKTPTISGGLFAINKKFFERLGLYDEGFEIWGAENLELSFKTWMCGGVLEIVPCSHVGHVFRKRFPYEGQKGFVKRNAVRLAEVWLDEYAKYYYQRIGYQIGYFGDISKRKQLRESLKCKSFKWYLENIYPQMITPDYYVANGQISNMNYPNMCLDSSVNIQKINYGINLILPCHGISGNEISSIHSAMCLNSHAIQRTYYAVNLIPCHNLGGNQFWVYTRDGEIRKDDLCLNNMLQMLPCHGKAASQIWLYDKETRHILNSMTKLCITAEKRHSQYTIVMVNCTSDSRSQKWEMENLKIEKLAL